MINTNFNPLERMWDFPLAAVHESGLYLMGQCIFNPFTKEEYYLVKVGKSLDLYQRLRQYTTPNPQIFLIDYLLGKEHYEEESFYQSIIETALGGKKYHSREWFQVSREVYLKISIDFSFLICYHKYRKRKEIKKQC